MHEEHTGAAIGCLPLFPDNPGQVRGTHGWWVHRREVEAWSCGNVSGFPRWENPPGSAYK